MLPNVLIVWVCLKDSTWPSLEDNGSDVVSPPWILPKWYQGYSLVKYFLNLYEDTSFL